MRKLYSTLLSSGLLLTNIVGCGDKKPQVPPIERPSLLRKEVVDEVIIDTLASTAVSPAIQNEDTVSIPVDTVKKEPQKVDPKKQKLKNPTEIVVAMHPAEGKKADDTIAILPAETPIGKCKIEAPTDYIPGNKPITRKDAEIWGKWMYKKATCFMDIKEVDSCLYYTSTGIGTYENGSLFALKAWCLIELKKFVAAKTAADISIARNDHWDKNSARKAFEYKISAIESMIAEYPSMVLQKELEITKNAYRNLYTN